MQMVQKSSNLYNREELIQKFDWEVRQLSTATTMAASAIAQQIGMNSSDLQCAELLVRMGPLTAGQLAELSGLTTGAITGVVDRLERAGWAKREADSKDRRRVIIRALPQDSPAESSLYNPYTEAMSDLLADYNDEELGFILEFISRLTAVTSQMAAQIQANTKSAK
ncbi:MAG: MarR family transcriptional regulator [Ardenticatenaceae bacterium]|nr:MarR family transcriptional regulator [Ardenticatenaceae bacterium]MCB8948754.1 MarR family transcriptional regulator [Ardenticatenaceae bacterium]